MKSLTTGAKLFKWFMILFISGKIKTMKRINPMLFRIQYIFLATVLSVVYACQSVQTGNELTTDERNKIIEAMNKYRNAWLRNDSAEVMDYVAKDMVLFMPNLEGKPKIGIDSIRAFWFPNSNVSYPITEYSVAKEKIEGNDQLCVYSGISKLSWHIFKGNVHSDSTTAVSEFMNVLKKEDGKWKLYKVMYNIKNSDYK